MKEGAGAARPCVQNCSVKANGTRPSNNNKNDLTTTKVHEALVEAGAYPSPLNYYNFPKSVCTSVNEVRKHAWRVGGAWGAVELACLLFFLHARQHSQTCTEQISNMH